MIKKASTTVDVIIPTFNGLPWLKAAVESVLNQTHTKLKLYIINDGSTDETENYVKSIKDKRITYIKKKNGGQSTARNLGIKLSSSPFVAFLDADDLWHPTKLEKQLDMFAHNPKIGLVYGHHYIIDEEDVVLGNLRIWKRGKLADDLTSGNIIAGSASMVLIKRKVLEEAGPFFREDFVNGEDWELWLRIALISEIDFVPEIIASIRQHSSSTQANVKRMADGLVHVYQVIKDELNLTKRQQINISSYCLYSATQLYYNSGNFKLARRTLFFLFRENPGALFAPINWKFDIRPSFFTKVVSSYKIFNLVGRSIRKVYRIAAKLIGLPFRALKLVYVRLV